jgi:cytochrome c peroxidase
MTTGNRSLVWLALVSGALACSQKNDPPAGAPAAAPTIKGAANESPTPPLLSPPNAPTPIDPRRLAAFQPLPKEAAGETQLTDDKVDLGHRLFFETGLSSTGKESCESCHVLEKYGVDGLPVAKGLNGKPLKRNTPTVFNVALNTSFGWDGRSAALEDFIKSHLADAEVMGASEAKVTALGKAGYQKAFAAAAPASKAPVSLDTAVASLGAYIRRLMTPSAWDALLGGDRSALGADQYQGFNAFMDKGCVTCHSGANLGGALMMKVGLVKPWPGAASGDADLGKYEVTKADTDKMMFRSASLRNVEKTGPYSFDGSVASLEEMTRAMGEHQLGISLTDSETKAIVAFLSSLSGKLPPDLILKPPELK